MRADRLISMLLLLQARGQLTAHDLSERLEVSERTVYRDVEALNAAGIPVYTQPGTSGGIFLDRDYRVSLAGLSEAEVMSLFAAQEAGPLGDLGLAKNVADAVLKLLAALPAGRRLEAERTRQRLYIDPVDWFRLAEAVPFLRCLQQAVWEERVVRMTYECSFGTYISGVIEPYGLVAKANVWYLVAKKPAGAFESFRISRFQAVTLGGGSFKRDLDFDLETFWKESRCQYEREMQQRYPSYAARVRVHPATLWLFYDGLMNCQYQTVGEPDANGWRVLDVVFPALENAIMHVLGLSTFIQVLEPDELRDWVIRVARDITNYYEAKPRSDG